MYAPINVRFKRLHPDAVIPQYQSAGASGMDLVSIEYTGIEPNSRDLVRTGLAVAIPEGFEGQIRPRSGLALKHGLTVLNAPGTIDSDYRGEIGIILASVSGETIEIAKGERIAQLVIAPVAHADVHEVEALPETPRGEGGFGSTGQ